MNLEKTLIRDRQKDTLLYAGNLKLRITDWFFLKDTIELKYIGLEDALIKQQRSDSVWNFKFIADYFSSPSSSNKKQPIVLRFQKIDLKNITYIKNDLWVGEKQVLKAGSVLLDAKDINLVKNRFVINSIDLDNFLFATYDLPGLRPERVKVKTPGMYFNEAGLDITVKRISITDGEYLNYKSGRPEAGFDGRHIDFRDINGSINNVSFIQDTIRANIDLSSRERSGLDVRKLSARLRLTPQIMEFSNLLLKTNRSELRDYYAMRFEDFNDDMNHYIGRVIMDAYFKNSQVSTDDIAFFAPEMRSWKKLVRLSGKFHGTVEDFNAKQLFMRSNDGNYVTGDLRMKGLPDIEKTQIILSNGSVRTNYENLVAIVPEVRQMHNPDLKALGDVQFNGNFSGTIRSFTTTGTMRTQLGGVYANIGLQFPRHGEPKYNGVVQTEQFNLGKFIHEPLLGNVAFNGTVKGSSFSLPSMSSQIDGKISNIEIKGYNYKNLVVNGTFLKKYFRGELKVDDPNIDFTSTVEVDFTHDIPRFNVLGDLVKSNLQKINLANEHIELTGLFDLNFSGRNIDEFLGSAKILNAIVTHENEKITFDSLVLESALVNGNKILSARSNEFDIT
ncbi:MAG: hypothetical protein JWN78_61, partial [Bacteroidota bacterium]|nr:hypothetical protein [Bacteroidota bacterium]